MNKLYGLLGGKLGHSLSEFIHSEIYKLCGIEGSYHLFEVLPENLESAISGLSSLGAVGVNVTIPYKCDVIKYIDNLSKEAHQIGAVNTVKFDNNIVSGYNTDYYGFKMLLDKNNINTTGKSAVILGSGGAADAVLQVLEDNGCKNIYVVTRNYEETRLKYKTKNVTICRYSEVKDIRDAEIIVNCTPCGMSPNMDVSPVEKEILSNYKAAVDLIYNPKETLFLKYAGENGLVYANGLYMLIAQAVAAEEIWNEIKIDSEIIDKIYLSMNNEKNI